MCEKSIPLGLKSPKKECTMAMRKGRSSFLTLEQHSRLPNFGQWNGAWDEICPRREKCSKRLLVIMNPLTAVNLSMPHRRFVRFACVFLFPPRFDGACYHLAFFFPGALWERNNNACRVQPNELLLPLTDFGPGNPSTASEPWCLFGMMGHTDRMWWEKAARPKRKYLVASLGLVLLR